MPKCTECDNYQSNAEYCVIHKRYLNKPETDNCIKFKPITIENVKHPICPINLYFEGDEDKCDESKCDFEDRRCSQACIILDKQENNMQQQQPVSHEDYMKLADAYDKHSRTLMTSKGEEYSLDDDFLAMENRLAGMLGNSPEYVSLVMAGKHITALGIILEKNNPVKIKLEKLDERIRDATNLLKITSAFIHAKQKDFSLHLGNGEKQ